MHDDLNLFKQNPSQKFCKNLTNFEKPQKFSRKPKYLGLMHEMHEEWRIKDPYQRRKAWSRPKSKWGRWRGWLRSVWKRNERVSVERDWWEMKKIALALYIDKYVAWWIGRYRELKMAKWSYRGAIERRPQQCDLDGLRSYQASIKHTETSSMNREAIKRLSRLILKNLDGSKLW